MWLNRCKSLLSVVVSECMKQQYKPLISVRNYAARKGTRARKDKKKIKVEIKKVGFIPHNLRNRDKMLANRVSKKFDDSQLKLPIDNVYISKYYQWKVYPFAEALKCHRETHHPDMYNKPKANVCIKIELNMVAEKITRLKDNFTRIAPMPHAINQGEERSIIAFTKDVELQEKARIAGAQLAGGIELIKQIQNGAVSLQDFEFVVAHPNILPELVALRGIMKRKFPSPTAGTLDVDLANVVTRFLNGLTYSAVKDEIEKDFGEISTVIGSLDMDAIHLEENFASLIQDVYKAKPQRPGSFITRCLMLSPPSREKFIVNHTVYLPEEAEKEESDSEGEEEVEETASTVAV